MIAAPSRVSGIYQPPSASFWRACSRWMVSVVIVDSAQPYRLRLGWIVDPPGELVDLRLAVCGVVVPPDTGHAVHAKCRDDPLIAVDVGEEKAADGIDLVTAERSNAGNERGTVKVCAYLRLGVGKVDLTGCLSRRDNQLSFSVSVPAMRRA